MVSSPNIYILIFSKGVGQPPARYLWRDLAGRDASILGLLARADGEGADGTETLIGRILDKTWRPWNIGNMGELPQNRLDSDLKTTMSI